MTTSDSLHSSFRENVLEHLFIGRCLQALWVRGVFAAEVLRADVDGSGYDLVVEANGIIRHIQLKASRADGRTARQTVNLALARKPGGCVVWMVFDPNTLDVDHFRWFGGRAGEPLPPLDGFKTAKHTKGNSAGEKLERPNIRVLPKARFERIDGFAELLERLFG